MKIGYLLITLFLSFVSCTSESSYLALNKHSKLLENKEIEEQSKVFQIDEFTLNAYQISSSYVEDKGREYIISYNGMTHSLDVINLNNNSISHIKLDKEGTNGIFPDISGLFIHNMDSIFLYSQYVIFQIDGRGEVIQKIIPPVPDGGFIMMLSNFSLGINNLYYNKSRNSIFYLTFCESSNKSKCKKASYIKQKGETTFTIS